MKVTIYIGLFAFLFWSFAASAQPGDSVEEAYLLYTQKDYESAAEIIDEVIQTSEGSRNPVAWHLRGFIYKEFFISADESTEKEHFRNEAVESFKTSMELDADEALKDQNVKALRYLAVSYYNDASDIILAHDPGNLEVANTMFFTYEGLLKYLYPDTSLAEKEIDFYLAMSTAHRKIYESDREKYGDHWNQSNDFFLKVLEIDPKSFKANYSLAVSHYNKGAFNLRKLPEMDDLHDIFEIQTESIRSIEVALRFMLNAYNIDPNRIETVRGLKIIYFNLNKEKEGETFDERERQLKMEQKK